VGRYITSNNPHLEYTNRTVSDTHKHCSNETTMTVLQSAREGERMEALENCYIRFFQHNNMIVNKQLQKEIDHLVELT
jgi:DTW domain-containing protein YfiP